MSELKRALEEWRPEDANPSSVSVLPDDPPASSMTGHPESLARVPAPRVSSEWRDPGAATQSDAPAKPVDIERLSEITSGDHEKLRRLIGIYMTQGEETLKSLEQAIRQGAARDIRHLAHKWGGASSSCGIVALVAPLSRLERLGESGQLTGAAEAFAEASTQFKRVRLFLNDFLQAA